MTEETLFERALNAPTADRTALLDREYAGDPALRACVVTLLAAHERLEAGPARRPIGPVLQSGRSVPSVGLSGPTPSGPIRPDPIRVGLGSPTSWMSEPRP